MLNRPAAVPIAIAMALFLTRTRGRSARSPRRLGRLSPGSGRRRQPVSGPTPISLVTPVANGTHHERPEPELRWTDAHHVPPGDFCASAIANAALTSGVVPERGDTWETVSEFALSYDGYAYWEDLPELASRVLQGWTRDRTLPDSLDELRGCLFYERRRWHHFGQDPAGRSAAYIWALADAIAEVVGDEDDSVGGGLVDPRPRRAPEAHVRILPTVRAVPAARDLVSLGARSAVAPLAPTGQPAALRLLATLEPPAAARAHVQLVSAIETESGMAAAVASRHPSVWRGGEERTTVSVHELRPMPSADPLPKPSVIEPRGHPAPTTSARTRATNGSGANGHGGNGNGVAIRTFGGDDAAFRAWMETHPEGFVLNRPVTSRAKAMTLHRVGCPVLAGHAMVGAASDDGRPGHAGSDGDHDGHPKVCGPSAGALTAWSRAQGVGEPVPCRRCHP